MSRNSISIVVCGIAGNIFFNDPEVSEHERVLKNLGQAIALMKHRGPDHHEIVSGPKMLMAHTRLSIIDTGMSAHQPMQSPDNRYRIIFNGEIFNFPELKNELLELGEEFQSKSDTEVLMKLLIRNGKSCLNRLNGFFAFAFYDSQEHQLLCARDRFGVKPFYYYSAQNQLHFASELRAMMKMQSSVEPDVLALSQLFTLTYSVAPNSIFSKISKLNPGEIIEAGRDGFRISKWYHSPSIKSNLSFNDASNKVESLLDDAVKKRLISDVPLGCFLSGGVDSSIIAALAKRHSTHLQTFSLGFPGNGFYDETPYAMAVAKHIGTHHEVIEVKAMEFGDEVKRMIESLDEPFADSSALAYFILCKHVRKKVTVALSGDGADEIFAGYNKYEALRRAKTPSWFNRSLPLLSPLLKKFPQGRSGPFANRTRQLNKYAAGIHMSPAERYWTWTKFSNESLAQKLLKRWDEKAFEHFRLQTISGVTGDLNTVLDADQNLVLANDMLVKSDVMSMANSLEIRTPFLDFRVVEFVNSLPESHKINHNGRKLILKHTFQNMLPPEVFSRKKHGFEIPVEKWLRAEWRNMVLEAFDLRLIRNQGLFDPNTCADVQYDFLRNRRNDLTPVVWTMIVFQTWWRKWVDSE